MRLWAFEIDNDAADVLVCRLNTHLQISSKKFHFIVIVCILNHINQFKNNEWTFA